MYEIFFGDNAGWFTLPAIIGTAVFLIRLGLMLAGMASVDLDLDISVHDADPGHAFQILSIQTITAFMMGFGWAALGAYRGSGFEWLPSVLIGVLGGVVLVWLLTIMLKGVHDLQSSGNVPIDAALNAEGTVYVSIPAGGEPGGFGQVRIVIGARARIYNALSDGEALHPGARVRVTRINTDNTVTVSPA